MKYGEGPTVSPQNNFPWTFMHFRIKKVISKLNSNCFVIIVDAYVLYNLDEVSSLHFSNTAV